MHGDEEDADRDYEDRLYDRVPTDVESEEAFEDAPKKAPRRRTKAQLGPPITAGIIESLDETQKLVVDDFLFSADKVGKKVNLLRRSLNHFKMLIVQLLFDHNLHNVPFTDTILRKIAIALPKCKSTLKTLAPF